MKKSEFPIVALVGSPNVGKSTLLNKISGKSIAVTSEVAGTTRDRQYVDISWSGHNFTLLDTAGLVLDGQEELEQNVRKQIEVALDQAQVVILVTDGKQPAAAAEKQILKKFRNLDKPIILAVNKIDSTKNEEEKLADFLRLGIKKTFGVSAVTGHGLGDLLDCITEMLPSPKKINLDDEESVPKKEFDSIYISIVGKPNVGKSSIFNSILKEERVVVSAVPGTTRTAIDSKVEIDGQAFTFIDTAGLKKKAYRQERPDIFSGFQTFKSIRRSDVCFFVLDSVEIFSKQDQQIAQEIFAMEKGCVILVNKIDLVKEPTSKKHSGLQVGKGKFDNEYGTLRDLVSHHFPFLWMCPVFFVSAKENKGLTEAIEAAKQIYTKRLKTVSQEELDELLKKKMSQNPPKLLRDQKTPKVFGLKQLLTNPPMFELSVNHPAAISSQFRKFLENGIVKELDFWGTPITLKLKGKDKT